jgi:hypothetical protein
MDYFRFFHRNSSYLLAKAHAQPLWRGIMFQQIDSNKNFSATANTMQFLTSAFGQVCHAGKQIAGWRFHEMSTLAR